MLDVSDWERATSELDSTNRVTTSVVPETCEWIDIGFAELGISKWSMDYRRLQHCSHRVLADTALAIPQLTALCQAQVAADQGLAMKIAERARAVGEKHRTLRASWAEEARIDWDASPLTLPRLASEVWDAVQDKDWVLSAGTLRGWARRLWDLDQPYRHPGKSLGTATQIGISLGVALAHKGSGRLVIDLQPDGDLMFDLGALWFAAKHEIPLLVVMFNNRAYYNDWEHQIRMARQRGTPEARAHIGMDLFGPDPDFAGVARALGWYAEGPIEQGNDLAPALARAIAQVEAGKPALIDTVTQHR
jgi:acetolactate synthase-1/2/3 large subunit